MKNLLILILVIISNISNAQLNLNFPNQSDYNINNLIVNIYKNNKSLIYKHEVFEYKFDDGYVLNAVIFLDKNNNFLDIVLIDKRRKVNGYVKPYEIQSIDEHNRMWNYKYKRKFIDFKINYSKGYYKILFDNNSYILIEFDKIRSHEKTRLYSEDSNGIYFIKSIQLM